MSRAGEERRVVVAGPRSSLVDVGRAEAAGVDHGVSPLGEIERAMCLVTLVSVRQTRIES